MRRSSWLRSRLELHDDIAELFGRQSVVYHVQKVNVVLAQSDVLRLLLVGGCGRLLMFVDLVSCLHVVVFLGCSFLYLDFFLFFLNLFLFNLNVIVNL